MNPRDAINQSHRTPGTAALVSVAAVALLAGLGFAFTWVALEIQSAVRAHVTGDSLWSQGQQEAVYLLQRYAKTGDDRHYERARQALAVPLANREVRLAMDREPPDIETAHAGLLTAGHHPEDIPKLIWMYRYFAHLPYYRRALEIWQEAEHQVLQIAAVGEALQQELHSLDPSSERLAIWTAHLEELNDNIRAMERDFSETLGEGARLLHRLLIILGGFMLILFISCGAAVVLWATRRITGSERKFRAIFEQAAVGMAQLTPQGRFIDVNESLCAILGSTREFLLNTLLDKIAHRKSRFDGGNEFGSLLDGRRHSRMLEKRLLRHDGGTVWCKLTFSALDLRKGATSNLIAIIEDISRARELSSELNYQATHDTLTGLINRPAFENQLRRMIHEVHQFGVQHVLCFLDLDQFKIVNDICGHMAGDALLRQIADILQQCLRRNDVLARLGGDEFGIIFSHCNLEDSRIAADKLRLTLDSSTFVWEGATFNFTASLGLVEINEDASDEFSLLRAADNACYAAKDQGRNAVHTYVEEDLVFAERRNEMQWVGRVREAVANNRLQLSAQRIISFGNETRLRFEVLVRLLDAEERLIMPGNFLPAAERYNIATLIDRWVVSEALNVLREHAGRLEDLEACHINLSAQSISRSEFLQFVNQALDENGVPAEKLCFEITETAAISNIVDARKFIESLRKRGCHFALDDFGIGLSSFGYLRSLPVDIIKIDGSFVRNIVNDEVHLAMVRSISEIGHLMNKLTVAEFVESHEAMRILRELDIDYAQGYVVHKPCSLYELLNENRKQAFLSTLP